MKGLVEEMRLALGSWRRAPLLAAVAIGTLALGIGATTAAYSVASGTLFNAVPWGDPARLVLLQSFNQRQGPSPQAAPPALLRDWMEQTQSFEGVAAFQPWSAALTDGDAQTPAESVRVTANALSLFGVRPLLGRVLEAADAEPGAAPVVLISQGLFERRYGADPTTIGRTIEINDEPMRVVGVLRSDQFFPDPGTELIAPLAALGEGLSRSERSLVPVALLKPGVPRERAQSELDAISQALAERYPDTDAGWTVQARRLVDVYAGGDRVRTGVLLLLAAVGFVLLIVCANVANILIARNEARRKELATRAALGASSRQIAAQLLCEAAVLALLACPLALLFGRGGLALLAARVPATIGWIDRVLRFDRPVLLFAAVTSVATLLLFGAAPALRGARVSLQTVLQQSGGRGSTAIRSSLRKALAAVQLALAVALLTMAVLLARSFSALQQRDPGIDVPKLLVATLALPTARYPEPSHWIELEQQLHRELAAAPGVRAVGLANSVPFGPPVPRTPFAVEGQPLASGEAPPTAFWTPVTADYFKTIGLGVKQGRVFDADDRTGGADVLVINQALADRYFRDQDPLQRRLDIQGRMRQIVGLVGNYHNAGMRDDPAPQVFVPFAQSPMPALGITLRADGDPAALAPALRDALRRIDPQLPFPGTFTMEQRIESELWTTRFLHDVMLLLGAVALLLSAVGVYGVVSYTTEQRRQEFGVRAALGAEPRQIAGLVLAQAGMLTLWGTGIGLLLVSTLAPILASLLFGTGPWSVPVFLGAAALVATVTLLAAAEPALRAARVDPMQSLRAE